MSLEDVRALVTVSDEELVPPPELFWHSSLLHGHTHVARVLVHAFRLVQTTGFNHEMPRLWAAVYLHDIARRHDGRSAGHGADAWSRLAGLPDARGLFTRGGVRDEDYPAIQSAVTHHSAGERVPTDPSWRLTALLKDADGLDRVRLGDLDPTYLRHPEAREMVRFAERLYRETDGKIRPSRKYFEQLWPIVGRLLADGGNDKRQSRTGCDLLVDEDRPEGWLACATDVSARSIRCGEVLVKGRGRPESNQRPPAPKVGIVARSACSAGLESCATSTATTYRQVLRVRPHSHEQVPSFTADQQQRRFVGVAANRRPQLLDSLDRLPIYLLNDVTGLKARTGCAAVGIHVLHDNALRTLRQA